MENNIQGINMYELAYGDLNRARYIDRFSLDTVHRKQNLAEHIFFVTKYSWLIGLDLCSKGHSIDMLTLLEKAIVHDDEETVLQDIVQPVKEKFPEIKNCIQSIAPKVIKQVYDSIGISDSDRIVQLWKRGEPDNLENKIVKFADWLDVLAYAGEEAHKGNMKMLNVYLKCVKALNEFEPPLNYYAERLECTDPIRTIGDVFLKIFYDLHRESISDFP